MLGETKYFVALFRSQKPKKCHPTTNAFDPNRCPTRCHDALRLRRAGKCESVVGLSSLFVWVLKVSINSISPSAFWSKIYLCVSVGVPFSAHGSKEASEK
jgi:hypothetical protein